MKMRASAILAAALLVCVTAGTGLAQTPYSQDFEALTPVNGSLAADGWLNFGNVFYLDGSYWYGYGPYPAVNNIGNWQDIVSGQGGPEQGLQQLVVYSDYQNGNHPSAQLGSRDEYEYVGQRLGISDHAGRTDADTVGSGIKELCGDGAIAGKRVRIDHSPTGIHD